MKTLCIPIRQNVLKTVFSLSLLLGAFLFTNSANAQENERTVTGVVKTNDGLLQYATVLLKGTQIGVSTDENGKFTFPQKLKENDVLVVTFLGYQDAEVKITGNTTFVEPFLEDIPLVIIGALRTEKSTKSSGSH